MDLNTYFALPNTPSAGSPVGQLITRILEKMPETSFEDARAAANAMIYKAAGKFNFRTPAVYTPAEEEARRVRLKGAFAKAA
jgi:hypothetical protein